ncbi:MAG: filamentous hemagglutinin N-terminal domain-containing protein [Rhizonema sp. PD37]|nr:filamentous hemagglutinin N-terminal domain-containing protein [Rhizonema sp. PD37]
MSKMGDIGRQLWGIFLGGAYVLGANCATAQITPARNLPNNFSVTINGSFLNVTLGTQTRQFSFRNFQRFSLPTRRTASFKNELDIQNIISQITGGKVSDVDGFIRANGNASLFVINSDGIIFGPNAALNIGSLLRTTIESGTFKLINRYSYLRFLAPSTNIIDASSRLKDVSCAALNDHQENKFIVTGRSGLPPTPEELLTSDVVWTDTRLPVTAEQHQHKTLFSKPKPRPIAIIPATGWVLNNQGDIMLISATNATILNISTSCPVR